METKHTPGPWTVNGDHISRLRPHKVLTGRDERGNRICGTEDRPEGIPVARVIFSSKEDGQANARLIASAPLMYERLVKEIGQDETDKLLGYWLIAAAFAKAAGNAIWPDEHQPQDHGKTIWRMIRIRSTVTPDNRPDYITWCIAYRVSTMCPKEAVNVSSQSPCRRRTSYVTLAQLNNR